MESQLHREKEEIRIISTAYVRGVNHAGSGTSELLSGGHVMTDTSTFLGERKSLLDHLLSPWCGRPCR